MEIKGYRKLIVWQEAKKLVTAVYRLTESFPRTEDYALKGQMRRAEVAAEVGYWGKVVYEEFDKQRSHVGYLLFRYKHGIQRGL